MNGIGSREIVGEGSFLYKKEEKIAGNNMLIMSNIH
jgi:hypothetical protein